MHWVSYRSGADGREHAAILEDSMLHAVDMSLLELLQSDQALDEYAVRARTNPFETLPFDQADVLAPISRPPSVRDFMAFESHVVTSSAALGAQVSPVWYEQPVFYFTNPAAILGPTDDVPMAPGTKAYDYELEVAAVVGRSGSDIAPKDAEQHIAGYVVLCDWSARDLQSAEMAVGLGPAKGKDTATTLGPFLVTPDELEPYRSGHGFDLAMTAIVNGRAYSAGNWKDLHWSFPQMLAYASRGTELRPGDIIGSGTVGTGCILELSLVHGHDAYPWLSEQDEVRLEVGGLGAIVARVVPAAQAPVPLV
jgi:2-keto-4-pentenoate hydratase/2-oxohepta-3-ene-1,7-dioic acid hydratase in catechol pathway